MAGQVRSSRLFDPIAEPCEKGGPGGQHDMVREVRDAKGRPGWRQDRMLCRHCKRVLYGWVAFKVKP